MKFLLASLLAVLSSWRVSSLGWFVTQTPDLSVVEGETVRVTCCWTVEFDRVRVQWLKNQSLCDQQHFNKVECQGSLHKEEYNCSTLTFSNITRKDSGRYVCKLFAEIPHYAEFEGNGTLITVVAKENTESHEHRNEKGPAQIGFGSEEVLVYVLRCLPILALVGTFFYFNNRTPSKPQRHTPDDPGDKTTSATREEDGEQEERV